ncbi:TcpE family conjugal transfer membrane protein [Nocardiopsis algeriensis]|uniref:MinD-like ATPase involved in chromosome partitioning or flagellar assembly n=1 Tax=Nocardiopsis algeriensis TaxID=1478215 RepID=A0A841IPY5_9ACTN|nr:MinD-like ATPase involved in chromosome partitioning or flagellar assembly [Nocardiopsis algeriensis]
MDLPTYTNIWRIEKRLYKLYDFRLPMPLPVGTFGVAMGVFLLWAMLLGILNAPFVFGNGWHLVLWVVPPGVITVLATRPVIEGKRLTELLLSQMRFLAEARVYTRLAPEYEPSEVRVSVRVWHRDPAAGPLPRRRSEREAVEEVRPQEAEAPVPAERPLPASAPPLRRAAEQPAAAPAPNVPGPVRIAPEPVAGPAPEPERVTPEPAAGTTGQEDAAPAPEHTVPDRTAPEPVADMPAPVRAAAPGPVRTAGGRDAGRRPAPARAASALAEREPDAAAYSGGGSPLDEEEDRPVRPARRGIGIRVLNYFGYALDRADDRPASAPPPRGGEGRRPGDGDGFEEPGDEGEEQRESDAWFASLRASSGETPVGLSSKQAYRGSDTSALNREEVAEAVAPAEKAEDAADSAPARRLRGRTQGLRVTRELEELRRSAPARAEERPAAAPAEAPAARDAASTDRDAAPAVHRRPEGRPHAAPWELGESRRDEPAGYDISDYAARYAAATGRSAAPAEPVPWLPPAASEPERSGSSAAPDPERPGPSTDPEPERPGSSDASAPERPGPRAAGAPGPVRASAGTPGPSAPSRDGAEHDAPGPAGPVRDGSDDSGASPAASGSEASDPVPAERDPSGPAASEDVPSGTAVSEEVPSGSAASEDVPSGPGPAGSGASRSPEPGSSGPAPELDHGTGEQESLPLRPREEGRDHGPTWNEHMSVLDRHLITADTPAPPRPKFADAVPAEQRGTDGPKDPSEWFDDGKRRHPDQPKVGDHGNPVIPAGELREGRAAEELPAKPPTQLDHGTGELASFAEVRDEPREALPDEDGPFRRRTAAELEEAEAAALARRRDPRGNPSLASLRDDPRRQGSAEREPEEPARTEDGHEGRVRWSMRASGAVREEAERTAAAPGRTAADAPETPDSRDVPEAPDIRDAPETPETQEVQEAPAGRTGPEDRDPHDGVFHRVAQNARRIGQLFGQPAPGQEPEPPRRESRPELELDHGTGEQESLGDTPNGVPSQRGAAPAAEAGADSGATRGWRRLARVVTGGSSAPLRSDLPAEHIERLRTPLEGPRSIVVLGCTGGAGQTVTALMIGHTLAAHRDERVVAVDVNPGPNGLSRRVGAQAPETLTALLANADAVGEHAQMRPYTSRTSTGLEVVQTLDDPYVQTLDERDYAQLTDLLGGFYGITLLDPAATGVARALPVADGLVLVAPANADAERAVSMTFDWLDGNGHAALRANAVLVVNGVSRRSLKDVDAAERVARGRCRAVVRIPWDDHLGSSYTRIDVGALRSSTQRAHGALGGFLVSRLLK